jgi:hypothetical protein
MESQDKYLAEAEALTVSVIGFISAKMEDLREKADGREAGCRCIGEGIFEINHLIYDTRLSDEKNAEAMLRDLSKQQNALDNLKAFAKTLELSEEEIADMETLILIYQKETLTEEVEDRVTQIRALRKKITAALAARGNRNYF